MEIMTCDRQKLFSLATSNKPLPESSVKHTSRSKKMFGSWQTRGLPTNNTRICKTRIISPCLDALQMPAPNAILYNNAITSLVRDAEAHERSAPSFASSVLQLLLHAVPIGCQNHHPRLPWYLARHRRAPSEPARSGPSSPYERVAEQQQIARASKNPSPFFCVFSSHGFQANSAADATLSFLLPPRED